MPKDGQAKVLSNEELDQLFDHLESHRYPEKNGLIFQLSFKLGLRVQEISLLRIREVADTGAQFNRGYKLKDMLILPKAFTKGARATAAVKRDSVRTSVRFSVDEFDRIVRLVEKATKAGKSIDPSDYYPEIKQKSGKTRQLPLADSALLASISQYLDARIDSGEVLRQNSPLVLSQKGGAYRPNTLQMHMSKMLRTWAGIDRASSHSGRRTLATKMLHDQGEHLKTVQQVLGHKSAATTTIYQELPESEVRDVLVRTGKSYDE